MPNAAFPTRSTPFPSRLIDDAMPALSDTEWRVLCVVVRQTLGWADGHGGRKEEDWLTQSQLKARTGRASEAVSRAIDGLVRKGLLLVRTEAGEPLDTPQQRRRCAGRLLFRLAAQALDTPVNGGRTGSGSSVPEQGSSASELRKANTTKETRDKTAPGGAMCEERDAADPTAVCAASVRTDAATTARRPDASDVRRFLLAYQERFAERSERGEAPPIAWGKDGRLIKELLAQYSYERLLELLTRFFESDDAWARKRGYALSCFPALLPALLMEAGGAQQARRRARATPLVMHGPTGQQWQQTGGASPSASLFERYPHLRTRVHGKPP